MAMIFTLTVHEPLAGMLAPVVCPKLSVVSPAEGAHVGEPVQVVLAEGVTATCRPAGSTSVNFAPVNWTVFVLVSVKVNVEMAFTAIDLGEKDLAIVG